MTDPIPDPAPVKQEVQGIPPQLPEPAATDAVQGESKECGKIPSKVIEDVASFDADALAAEIMKQGAPQDAGATPHVFSDYDFFSSFKAAPERTKMSPVDRIEIDGDYVIFVHENGARSRVHYYEALRRAKAVRDMLNKETYEAKWDEIERNQWLTEQVILAAVKIREKMGAPFQARSVKMLLGSVKSAAKGFRHRK